MYITRQRIQHTETINSTLEEVNVEISLLRKTSGSTYAFP